MPNLTLHPANKNLWIVLFTVVMIVVVIVLVMMRYQTALAPGDEDLIPVISSPEDAAPVVGSVPAVEFNKQVTSAGDLDSSLSDLESVNIDYLDAALIQNDADAAQF